ncbi:MAG: ABC transporter ATP-binding protein [Opitutales bacterium]|nr:ABC transporter ATP-binding protein [Opitutales bacterium]
MDSRTENGPLLEAEDLSKSYADVPILDRVTLRVDRGERVALMGPSGSGKTTFLNLAGGIDTPDSGSLRFEGRELSEMTSDERAGLRRTAVGTVFQFFHLLPTMTAAENVEVPLRLLGVPRAERRRRVSELLDETGVARRADALPSEMSGGEMQRVAIARALAPAPRLLLADEPTGNLDSVTGERILDLIESVCRRHNTALLMVTHNPDATRVCHRVLQMRDGRITGASESATPERDAEDRP